VTAAPPLTWTEYAERWAALHGGVDPRGLSRLARSWLRIAYAVGRALAPTGMCPGAVTLVGLTLSLAVVVVAPMRGIWLFAAAGLVLLAALADTVDGSVAVIGSRATRLGAFYDAVADRLGEAAWLLALWLLGVPGWLVVVCGGLTWLHEYMRARATVAGMAEVGVGAVGERPTRVVLTAAALALGGAAWLINPYLTPGTVTVVVAVWIVAGLLGVARLATFVRTALREP
jgi:phosphatidylglycerophosphate synthase